MQVYAPSANTEVRPDDDANAEFVPKLLIIDDSPANIRLLANILEDKGTIHFATNGHDGLKLARRLQPQIILLDIEMPDMDGYHVCKELRNDDATRDCAIIFVTGNTGAQSELKALESGAVDFLSKPLNPPVVRARVQTHLSLAYNAELLRKLASRDGLTGLFNRRYFDHQLGVEWRRHLRENKPLALAMIDVDHFKAYNDGYGHIEGDACLRLVAKCIEQCTRRPGEVVARYGGEEFAVILPSNNGTAAIKYGERLNGFIRQRAQEHRFSAAGIVTISIGIASLVPAPGQNADLLIKQADTALYSAKHEGRDRARLYDPESHA